MEIVNTVLQQMSSLNKPQRRFLLVLLPLLVCLRGRVNFRNLSRYSDYHEKTFARWYQRDVDFTEFNRLSLQSLHEDTADTLIAPPLTAASSQKAVGIPRDWVSITAAAQAEPKRGWKYRRWPW
ncbi:hypothetical protein HLB35_16015 [Halomonas sp. TBZ9]|uniref:Transposase n=1 Tax=Vreelandella azerica TaxID=2732867 RepID=A0A7Y3TZH2_9GAMM|nr:hypothetical protein [Halomonas azerica]NOG32898.1 hypothetical protein [Halomonas azerica]